MTKYKYAFVQHYVKDKLLLNICTISQFKGPKVPLCSDNTLQYTQINSGCKNPCVPKKS